MPCLLIIDKSGSIKELNVKTYSEDELYKKAGFKTADGFELATSWDLTVGGKKYFISVYGKKKGRAGQENKYDFPPPIDSTLFFGSCLLVNNPEGEEVGSITNSEWEKIYEHLFGGFEDIGSEDSDDESEEDDEDELIPKTKTGYAKDGFVVDDNEKDEESDDEEEDEEEEITIKVKPAKKLPKWATKKVVKPAASKKPRKKTVFDSIEMSETDQQPENSVLECSDELKEEEYV